MRITSWNFLHGQRLSPDDERSLESAINSLASDVLALQEIDLNLERSARANQPAEIAAAMGGADWGFAATVHGTPGFSWRPLAESEQIVTTSASEAATDLKTATDLYGVAIASKLPVAHWLRLELGKSLIGMPLLIANEKGKVAPFYVKDEPRVALAAVLECGWTIINTHLSFVPLVNIYQLFKVTRWSKQLEREYGTKVILLGDFNLPWGLPVRLTKWLRATNALSYPSWKPAISFDYILMSARDIKSATEVVTPLLPISDHRPIAIEIN